MNLHKYCLLNVRSSKVKEMISINHDMRKSKQMRVKGKDSLNNVLIWSNFVWQGRKYNVGVPHVSNHIINQDKYRHTAFKTAEPENIAYIVPLVKLTILRRCHAFSRPYTYVISRCFSRAAFPFHVIRWIYFIYFSIFIYFLSHASLALANDGTLQREIAGFTTLYANDIAVLYPHEKVFFLFLRGRRLSLIDYNHN